MIDGIRIRYASIIVWFWSEELLACAAKHLLAYTEIFAMGLGYGFGVGEGNINQRHFFLLVSCTAYSWYVREGI